MPLEEVPPRVQKMTRGESSARGRGGRNMGPQENSHVDFKERRGSSVAIQEPGRTSAPATTTETGPGEQSRQLAVREGLLTEGEGRRSIRTMRSEKSIRRMVYLYPPVLELLMVDILKQIQVHQNHPHWARLD